MKLKFSEDISYNTISNFGEKQLIPSGATLIVQKPFFDPKIQIFVNLMFKQCLFHKCLKLYQNWCNFTCFIINYEGWSENT